MIFFFQGDHNETVATPAKKAKTFQESPLRRSSRQSASEDEDSKVISILTVTPQQKSAKKSAKKSVTISDASSESETEKESDALLKSANRKRKLSEAPKLQIIPEVLELEETEESPAKKPRRKSVSATAVMQKNDETPSKRRGRPPKSVGNEEPEPKSKFYFSFLTAD